MVDEIRIDEVMLNKALELVNVGGEQEHRLLYHLINQIAEMGYRWRSEYVITLFDGESEPNFNSKYAEYLDKKAQRQNVVWSNVHNEEE
jgi:hypothetical protein|tara:strand:- start:4309 stop:4575 length:267 start_codon:yes stop_codon:yes gene_type:complete